MLNIKKINMSILFGFTNFIIFIIIRVFNCQLYCGINQITVNYDYPTRMRPKLSSDTNYRSIQIYLDTTDLNENINNKKLNITITALNSIVKVLQKLIEVKQLNYEIVIDENALNNWGITNYSSDLLKGIDTDLIVLFKFIEDDVNYYMSSEPKYIDEETKRPIVGIIYITDKMFSDIFSKNNVLYYIECLLLHQFTHILGFLYQLFHNFPGGLEKVLFSVSSDKRSNITRNYIITPKVLDFAKKYYGCENIIGVELEDQDKNTNSHWEARTLLGEFMNSNHYLPEQAISEFTLALLDDSGWYKINYYTGGLMRYGKNKGCDFLNKDCLNSTFPYFKNEFFDINDLNNIPGCSSGRQSRVYGSYESSGYYDFQGDFEVYNRFHFRKSSFDIADYCLVYDSKNEEETASGHYVGSCNRGNGGYGTYIIYNNRKLKNSVLEEKGLGEKYGYNSFCILSSVSTIEARINNEVYKFQNNVIHPMCYPMFCSERSLTIQINNWFVVCPRSGGKVQVNNIYEGYLFCPDYNLICTGKYICNDMFDCVEKGSLIKNESFVYDYEIKTSQIFDELINSQLEPNSYELSEDGQCPKDCEQCNHLKQCFFCREGFYYIGEKEDESRPIYCKNISISIGYYKTTDENNKSIYYPCSDSCEQCNKTHCFQCDNYHKLDENNIFCVEKVKHCEIYENVTFTCIKCRDEYVFIGLDKTTCHIINKTKYYSNDEGISYYLCNSSIPYCDECDNSLTCNKCVSPYYFLEDNRTNCYNDKNLSKYFTEDNGISYFPCDKNFPYCDECINRTQCIKCIDNYHLVNENGIISCKNIDINKYYKEEKYYYPCYLAIDNCDECDQKSECKKCKTNYYFLKDNRTFCRNDIDITNKYYTNDKGISYYPCDTHFEYCDECMNETICRKCINTYGFFVNDYTKCIFVGNNKYYSLDEGITFDLCNNTFPNCDECTDNECTKCYENYYFIKTNRRECFDDKNLSKYYTEDNGKSYYPCNEEINHCDVCFNNKTYCYECEGFNGYYFLRNIRNVCRNDLNFSKYYTEDNGISYYPCNEIINYCDECQQKEKCDKCMIDYFFIGNNRDKCYNEIDFKKYFTNDSAISYYPCNTTIEYCDECFNENICNKCYNSYILLFESPTECFEESLYMNNDNYFKLNDTHYKKCSSSIDNCDKCISYNNCTKCDNNYYFLNNDHSKCILESNIIPKDEFFKLDEDNYYSCSYQNAIINCQKCTNNSICRRCKEEYALVYNFFNKCVPKNELIVGYYHNGDSTIYYPCIENCDKCINSFECEQCLENFVLLNEKTLCENCEIKIENINDEFSQNVVNITEYLKLNKKSMALHYMNNKFNYSITIFKAWECTEGLWEKNYFKFNTSSLNYQINKKLNIKNSDIIYMFTNKNYKNYLEIYNSVNGQKINIQEICPDCVETGYEITNNYSLNLKNELGNVMYNKIKENNINIFDKGDKYISGLCQNFTISKIDLSVPDRINILYIGDYTNEIICTDKNCEIESKEISDFYGICKCQLNSDFNYLITNYINIMNSENKNTSYETSFSIFKCIKAGFSSYIVSNTGFYLYIIFIFIQTLCFIFFVFFEKNNILLYPKKKDTPNPPKKDIEEETLFIENFDDIENTLNNDNNSSKCNEKDIQDKDEGYFFEDIDSASMEYDDFYNNKSKNSTKTHIKSETNSIGKGKRKSNRSKIQFQDTKDAYLDKDNDKNYFSYKSKLRKMKEKRNIDINSDINTKCKDILSFNYFQKKNKKKVDFNYSNTEGNENINKLNKRGNKFQNEYSQRSNEIIFNKKNNISPRESPEIIPFNEAKKKNNLSFCGYYWYLLGLKQPLLNLASQIKMFKITESFIPSGIKLIKFFFIIGLDFFVNCLFISQKYFSNKFKYFDKKYNIRYVDLGIDISTNERFSYGFKNTILYAVYTFLICSAIQGLINFFYFNLRKRIDMIIANNNNVEEEIKDYLDTVRIKYKFMYMINIVLMFFFWYYVINFSAVYRGGDIDYISASIMTFLFLQIFPFFICLVLAIFIYCGLKNSEEKLYNISQYFVF